MYIYQTCIEHKTLHFGRKTSTFSFKKSSAMAEEYFHGEVCGAGNWWTSSTNTFGSSLCSSNINQTPNLGWPNHMIMDMNTRFNDDSSSPSDGSIVLQDAQQATGFEISSSTTPYNWNPDFLLDNLNSSMNYLQQTGIRELDSKNWIKDSSFYPSSLDYLPIKYQSPANNYLMKNPNEFSPSLPQIINPNKKPDITESHLIKEVDKETRRLSSAAKKTSSGQALKRPRIETPSPLPTFKVRKEKLGDRITVLQQLVSPFGKTDTASVLREAIEYIKFLHDQINALSTAYMKNGSSIEARSAAKQDLRSHGLCLVPLSSTFPVATETVNDFWTPTSSGGTFR